MAVKLIPADPATIKVGDKVKVAGLITNSAPNGRWGTVVYLTPCGKFAKVLIEPCHGPGKEYGLAVLNLQIEKPKRKRERKMKDE